MFADKHVLGAESPQKTRVVFHDNDDFVIDFPVNYHTVARVKPGIAGRDVLATVIMIRSRMRSLLFRKPSRLDSFLVYTVKNTAALDYLVGFIQGKQMPRIYAVFRFPRITCAKQKSLLRSVV